MNPTQTARRDVLQIQKMYCPTEEALIRHSQNISVALGIKAVFLGLALSGIATLWMAVFAAMGASLIVVFNGLRLLRTGARIG